MIPATALAAKLRSLGVIVGKKISEPNDLEDGQVELTHGFHVSVGFAHIMLVKESGTIFTFYEECHKLDELLVSIGKIPKLRPRQASPLFNPPTRVN